MSLDFIFVPTTKPVLELKALHDLDENISTSIVQNEQKLRAFFPEFVFERFLGKHRTQDISCEANVHPSSIHVGMRGSGDVLKAVDIAFVLAAESGFATVDVQSSQLYAVDRAKEMDYLSWYRGVLEQYYKNT